MAFKSLVLHLGAHKTGTSLVQKYLRDRAEACEKAHIFAMDRGDGDRLIGWGRQRDYDKVPGGLQALMQSAADKGVEHVILSHENSLGRPLGKDAAHLYPDARTTARRLKAQLGDQPYRVIYYLRGQESFLESYYLQTVHEGAFHSFDEFLASLGTSTFSWRPLYDTLCAEFGAENVVIRAFEEEIQPGQEHFMKRFMEAAVTANLDAFGNFTYRPVRNPSVGDRGLELALGVNKMLKPSERKLFRKFFQEHFSNRQYPRPTLFSEAQKADLQARYGAENAEILALSAASAKAAQ